MTADETVSIIPAAGKQNGLDTVRFGESSSSQIVRTTSSEYVTTYGPFAWLSIGCVPAHLTRAEVAVLHDHMGLWLARHPEPSKSMEVPDVV